MRGRVYTQDEKDKVKKLLLGKKSYAEITKLLGIPKSTVCTWYGKSLDRPWQRCTQLEHLKNIRKLAVVAVKRKWDKKRVEDLQEINSNLEKELPTYPFQNQGFYKSLLAMLYWAEGDKGNAGTRFANTDPNLARLYISLLRRCYNIDESKLRVRLHLHYYHSVKKMKKFWSKELNVPLNQFTKTSIKKRSKTKKFRKNFAGICFIYYGNSKIRKELLELGLKLEKTIVSGIPNIPLRAINNNAPVAQWIE